MHLINKILRRDFHKYSNINDTDMIKFSFILKVEMEIYHNYFFEYFEQFKKKIVAHTERFCIFIVLLTVKLVL